MQNLLVKFYLFEQCVEKYHCDSPNNIVVIKARKKLHHSFVYHCLLFFLISTTHRFCTLIKKVGIPTYKKSIDISIQKTIDHLPSKKGKKLAN